MQAGGVRQPRTTVSPATLLAVLALALLGVGLAFAAVGLAKATALLLGLIFLVPALLNLPVAIALWAPLAFLPSIAYIGAAPTAAGAMILLAWLPTLRDRLGPTRAMLRLHAPTIVAATLLLLWVTLSVSWAGHPDNGTSKLWQWWFAGAAFLVTATTMTDRRHLRLLVLAIFVGAVLAAVFGFFGESLTTTESSLELAAEDRRRFGSFLDDPNYLAAGFVAVIILATGLLRRRHPIANTAIFGSMALLTVAFAATESRGGLVAAAVTSVAALLLYRGRRAQVLVFLAVLVSVGAVFFSVTPDAWKRISEFDSTGSGRSGLWEVAWRITEDHPLGGVGLGNFVEEAPKYTQQPGKLDVVRNIAEKPHVTHNVYLQFLAETGFVGLILFFGLLLTCMRAAWRAANVFDGKGDHEMAALSRACLLGMIAFASASVFISDGNDVRFWILLALGPVAYGAASRTPSVYGGDGEFRVRRIGSAARTPRPRPMAGTR
jgi:O-antigen ligase